MNSRTVGSSSGGEILTPTRWLQTGRRRLRLEPRRALDWVELAQMHELSGGPTTFSLAQWLGSDDGLARCLWQSVRANHRHETPRRLQRWIARLDPARREELHAALIATDGLPEVVPGKLQLHGRKQKRPVMPTRSPSLIGPLCCNGLLAAIAGRRTKSAVLRWLRWLATSKIRIRALNAFACRRRSCDSFLRPAAARRKRKRRTQIQRRRTLHKHAHADMAMTELQGCTGLPRSRVAWPPTSSRLNDLPKLSPRRKDIERSAAGDIPRARRPMTRTPFSPGLMICGAA